MAHGSQRRRHVVQRRNGKRRRKDNGRWMKHGYPNSRRTRQEMGHVVGLLWWRLDRHLEMSPLFRDSWFLLLMVARFSVVGRARPFAIAAHDGHQRRADGSWKHLFLVPRSNHRGQGRPGL